MLRLAAGLLIVGASIAVGYYLSSKLSRRRKVLGDYIALLDRAANCMSYTGENLASVFNDNFAGFVFNHSTAFRPQWERMTDSYRDILNEEDRRILNAFAQEIGSADVPSEVSRIRLYQSLLRERCDEARDACEKKGALYRILPFSVGLVIAILLL